ncbi:MAG: choice-of-anchor tandem repeat NxxGxxAF-containing protein [Planctomycetota bacterium]
MLQYGQAVQAVGDPAPGALGASGVTIGGTSPFSVPVMDLDGLMLWRGRLTGGAIVANTDDQALFVGHDANDVQLVLQRGAPEPTGSIPGAFVQYSLTTWDAARIAPTGGRLLFASTLTGAVTTADDSVLFWGAPGALQVLAREGDFAPTGGASFSGNFSGAQNVLAINGGGMSLFKAKLVGGDAVAGLNDDAWFIGQPGFVQFMCREGDALSGGAVVVGTLDGFRAQIDENHRVLFAQSLSQTLGTSPATATTDSAILSYDFSNGLQIVAREGDPAPGSGACGFGPFSGSSGFSNSALSRTQGWWVVTNSMVAGDVSGNTDDTAIFVGQLGGGISRVARESEPAPTGVPGEIYQALFPNGVAQINDRGTVAFVAQLGPATAMTPFDDVGVFVARPPYGPGDVQLVLREGQAVAGLPAGWVIGNTSGGGMSSSGTTLLLNERDTLVVSVAGIGDPNQANWGVPALIGWDPEHGARLVSAQDEVFTIQGNPQTMSAAQGIVTTSSGDGCPLSLNNHGDLCIRAFFSGTAPNAVMRTHVGAMVAEPVGVAATGGTQTFHLDAGPGFAGHAYLILASSLGARPGFPSPLGSITIPLNFDAVWTQLSFDLANGAAWTNTFGLTSGSGTATASFNLPPGFSYLQGLELHHAAVLIDGSLTTPFVTEPSKLVLY